MDPVTHVAAGLVISQVLPGPSRGWSALAGAGFAVLPDIDYFLIFFDRLAFIRDHRSFTHSLGALPLLALLGAALCRGLGGPRWFRPIFFLGLAVLASHLLLDLATSYGTQLLFPFSRQRFSLDLLFIIDPYFTGLLLAGAMAALASAAWGRTFGAFFLLAAGAYLLVCAFYHQEALTLAREVYGQPVAATALEKPGQPHTSTPPGGQARSPEEPLTVAALPQPFSCRRWQLIAANSAAVQQAFVQMPYLPSHIGPVAPKVVPVPANLTCRVPNGAYRPPAEMRVQVWSGLPAPDLAGHPEAQKILEQYLEFARFPLLRRQEPLGDGELLEWLDLRFSVPGRDIPFVLQLQLDADGRVQKWQIGRCRDAGN